MATARDIAISLLRQEGCGNIAGVLSQSRRAWVRSWSGRVFFGSGHRPAAMTQAHRHPAAKDLITRRKGSGDSGLETLRVLKRRLSDVIYAALHADLAAKQQPEPTSDSAAAGA